MQTRFVLHADNMESIIQKLRENLSENKVSINKVSRGAECTFEENENNRKAIYVAIRKYIVELYEEEEIERIIKKGYSFFDSNEKKMLVKSVKDAIKNEIDIHNQLFVMRRNRIIESVFDGFLRENDFVNIDGFLPFRMESYRNELKELIDYNADSIMLQKEYEEFIMLLRSYISSQPFGMNVLNIVVTENREYLYYDENRFNLTSRFNRLSYEEFGGEFSSEDQLVNILINYNPKEITIHNRQFMKREIADTIESIFFGRITKCDGCKLCSLLQ